MNTGFSGIMILGMESSICGRTMVYSMMEIWEKGEQVRGENNAT